MYLEHVQHTHVYGMCTTYTCIWNVYDIHMYVERPRDKDYKVIADLTRGHNLQHLYILFIVHMD